MTNHVSRRRRGMKATMVSGILSAAIALAAPVQADVDTDFANELHTFGIYSPIDYGAWLGKITCERLHNGQDTTADKSAHFALANLPRGSTTVQSYQFTAAAIGAYCPDQLSILTSAAGRRS
jgi:hypothetical protein